MKRSKFSLSNYKLLTCDAGELVPIGLVEVLPGDSIQLSTSLLLRVSPLLAPVMHPLHVRIHHWFVPHRITWDGWETFITGGDGFQTVQHPVKNLTPAVAEGSLADYFGIPPGYTGQVSALPFRAYAAIFNEWYRDQDLVSGVGMSKGDGLDNLTNLNLLQCAWEKDYFTSARPWPQKGPDVTLSLGTSAPVIGTGGPEFQTSGGLAQLQRDAANNNVSWANIPTGTGTEIPTWANTGLTADLSAANPVSINELREAFALQRYAEARARYGSRYTEYLRYLGIKSSDARLQRPEYLGGGKQTVQFSEVLQTGPTGTTDEGVGQLRGHGIGAMRSNRFRRFFEEHGYIVSLLSIKPKTMYTQGLARTWSRTEKEHYFQKELQHIGQQVVTNQEIYAMGPNPGELFGYQDRYDEYRRAESSISGNFRSTLDYWHYAREFSAPPVLNASFVTANPTKRVYAEQTEDSFWIMANHSIQARRMVASVGKSYIY